MAKPGGRALLDELIELKIKLLQQYPFFRKTPSSAKIVRTHFRLITAGTKRPGAIEVLRKNPDAPIQAAVILAKCPTFFSRKPQPTGTILLREGDLVGEKWVLAMLKKHRHFLVRGFTMHLDAHNHSLLNDLAKLGIHIDSVVLGGDPRRASQSMKRRYGALNWNGHPLFRVQELKTSDQLDAVMKIIKREFSKNPQFGWFVTNKEFQKSERKNLDRERKKKTPTHFVIIDRRERVLAHFGFTLRETSVFGKRMAGMVLNFDQSIQGKGLSKMAYSHLLERMVRLKVGIFVGGTSQKPVMKLAKVMGRPLIAYSVRREKPYFSGRHFQ